MGQKLEAVRYAAGLKPLLDRIRADDSSARAELSAAYLCVPAAGAPAELEFGVPVRVGDRERVPDFRIRRVGEPWTYVEVTAPEVSGLQRQAQALIDRLAGRILAELPLGSTVEIMVRRDPTEQETNAIAEAAHAQLAAPGSSRQDLPGLALLLVGSAVPGEIVIADHGEPVVPRIGLAVCHIEGAAKKHVAVRYPFSDQRAESFLTSEAQQLPRDTPALVMVDVARAAGALKAWAPLLARRLQPGQHTRVSAIALFMGGMRGLPEGEAWVPETRALQNPHAVHPAPGWLMDRLRSWVAPQ